VKCFQQPLLPQVIPWLLSETRWQRPPSARRPVPEARRVGIAKPLRQSAGLWTTTTDSDRAGTQPLMRRQVELQQKGPPIAAGIASSNGTRDYHSPEITKKSQPR